MMQNIFVAGCARRPEAFGFHTELLNTMSDNKVSKVLAKVEEQYPADFRAPIDQKKLWKVANQRRYTVITDINADSADGASILSETHKQVLEPVESVMNEIQKAKAEKSHLIVLMIICAL